MKISRVLVATVVVTVSAAVAAPTPSPTKKARMTPEQRDQLIMEKVGGILNAPIKGKVVRIVNAASVKESTFDYLKRSIANGLMFPLEISAGTGRSMEPPEGNAGIVVKLVDDGELPMTILTAPENASALVNVAALKKDNPTDEVLEARIHKEVWRALVYTLGGGNTDNPQCPMKSILNLKDLDSLVTRCPSPDVFNRVMRTASRLGIGTARRVSYMRACQEGWAPAPTNKFQQAIWDKAHEIPKSPMKIEFDPKKGR